MNPGMAGPMMVGGPVPPALHWALVWLLGMVTLNIFVLVWLFKQANFVKSIDPRSTAKTLYIAGLLMIVLYIVLIGAGVAMANSSAGQALMAGAVLVMLSGAVCIIVGHLKMRSSLVAYYNSVENIGLRLSGVMTFFFNIFYFQHHFTRIAEWKRTGVLRPQG